MAKWAVVARSEDVADDGPHHVAADGIDAVLVRVDGELRAFEGLCPHQGALLGEGELIDGQLVCRNHRWCFDADTGERDGGPQCLQKFPVRIVNGRVELDLSEASTGAGDSAVLSFDDLDGPRALPIVGSALSVTVETLHLDVESWAREYGPVFRYRIGPNWIIAVSDPAIIAEGLRARPETFTRLASFKPVFKELQITGVFSEEGEPWRPLRRLTMGALNPRRVRAFFPLLHDVTLNLKKRWERAADAGDVVDIQSDMMRFTIDVTTRLAFSEETDIVGGESNALLDNLDPIFPMLGRRINALVPYWRLLKLPADRRAEAALKDVRQWVIEIVEETRRELQQQGEVEPQNFIESMLLARDEHGEPFPEEVIFGNALQILGAGEDTTANTMAWATHLLMEEPAAERALREAVDDVLGDAVAAPTMEVADRLEAVNAVANETMRLKPVAPMLFLTARHDTVIGGLAVEEGATLHLLTRMPGLDPKNVVEPMRFKPERWEEPRLLARMQRSGTFVPFGSGPRICPGRSLALLEIRMVLSMLYRNFRLERVGRAEDVEEVFGFTMSPRGLRVRLHRR